MDGDKPMNNTESKIAVMSAVVAGTQCKNSESDVRLTMPDGTVMGYYANRKLAAEAGEAELDRLFNVSTNCKDAVI